MSEQRQTSTGIWGLVIIGVLALYPVSLGPSCWLSSRFGGEDAVTVAYRPLTRTCEATNSAILQNGVDSYARLGAASNWYWVRHESRKPGEAERVKWVWTELEPGPL